MRALQLRTRSSFLLRGVAADSSTDPSSRDTLSRCFVGNRGENRFDAGFRRIAIPIAREVSATILLEGTPLESSDHLTLRKPLTFAVGHGRRLDDPMRGRSLDRFPSDLACSTRSFDRFSAKGYRPSRHAVCRQVIARQLQ